MATTADRVMVDTSVLLSATDRGRAAHARATAVLDDWPARGATLYTSGQVLREYVAVATRPVTDNGLGLSRAIALANTRKLHGRMQLLEESMKVLERLLGLLEEVDCTGKQVHDANVVATMSTHGITSLVTQNVTDFRRFEPFITVRTL